MITTAKRVSRWGRPKGSRSPRRKGGASAPMTAPPSVMAILTSLTDQLAAGQTEQDLYDSVVLLLQSEPSVRRAALYVPEDGNGRRFRLAAARGYGKDPPPQVVAYDGAERVAPEACDNDTARLPRGRARHTVTIPLRANSHLLGLLTAEKHNGRLGRNVFAPEQAERMKGIAAAASLALQSTLYGGAAVMANNQDGFVASVVRHRLDETDVFFHVDPRHFRGPMILRDGRSAPRMKIDDWFRKHPEAWDELPDAVRARDGSLEAFLASLGPADGYSADPSEWPRGLSVQEHERRLRRAHPGLGDLTLQGDGDVGMNLYALGALGGRLIYPPEERARVLRALQQDPASTPNHYSCLLKTRCGANALSVRTLRVDYTHDPPDTAVLHRDGAPSGVALCDIEWAVSGRQLVRDGKLVGIEEVIDQFTDLRHIFALVELAGRFYGRERPDRIYFGEAQLVDDPELCLRALREPVRLDTDYVPNGLEAPLGADPAQVIEKLRKAGYVEVIGRPPSQPGEFCRPGLGRTEFSIFLKRSYYPVTMVGLDERRETLYLMAVSGQSGRFSLTVPDAAKLLRDRFGVWDALVMDEGLDVFQHVGPRRPVPMNRRQVRAVIAVGRYETNAG